MKFWVQMHELPVSMLDFETALELGEKIGTISSVKNLNELIGVDFLQIRFEVHVLKPLCRGCRVALNDKDEVWVSFKYEKLSNFCYWCAKVSHTNKECEKWLASKGNLTLDQQEYGAWFRAPPYNTGKTHFMKVSGIGDGFGRTQSRKSTSVKDTVGYVHETSGEQPSSVELSDQSHNGVTDVENHQFSNLVSSDLVEDFQRGAHIGVISKFDLVDLVLDLSLIPNQSTNFEFQLKEIKSKIQKFDNDKNP